MSDPDEFDSLYANLPPKYGPENRVRVKVERTTPSLADPISEFVASLDKRQAVHGHGFNTHSSPDFGAIPSTSAAPETPYNSPTQPAPTYATSKSEPFLFLSKSEERRFHLGFHDRISIPERYKIIEEERELRRQAPLMRKELALKNSKLQNRQHAEGPSAKSNPLEEEGVKKSKKSKRKKNMNKAEKAEDRKARSAAWAAEEYSRLARQQQAAGCLKVEEVGKKKEEKKGRERSCPDVGGVY